MEKEFYYLFTHFDYLLGLKSFIYLSIIKKLAVRIGKKNWKKIIQWVGKKSFRKKIEEWVGKKIKELITILNNKKSSTNSSCSKKEQITTSEEFIQEFFLDPTKKQFVIRHRKYKTEKRETITIDNS